MVIVPKKAKDVSKATRKSKGGFVTVLKDLTVAEGTILFPEVEVADKKAEVDWYHNQTSVKTKKSGILNMGYSRKLYLGQVQVSDSGEYHCSLGSSISCSMTLNVQTVAKDLTVNEDRQRDVNEKQFQCANCSKGFRQKKSFDDHVKTHGDRICGEPGCRKRYDTQKLEYHLKKQHILQDRKLE